MARRERVPVAVLGATGAVGQRLVTMLAGHPRFELVQVAASDRSAGRRYGEAVRWLLPGGPPPAVAGLTLLPCDPGAVGAPLVFSALDAPSAREVEPAFRAAGRTVVTNASALRMAPEVPLVVPEVNGGHLALLKAQRARWGGGVAANPNCSTIGLVLALEPLRRAFGVRRVAVTTLQALSGAGHPGVPSLDALDNVVPEIPGEEEKLETEPQKIFGALGEGGVAPDPVVLSAQCNRVPVRDGHTLSISVELGRPAAPEEAATALAGWRSPLADLGLPSAPEYPVVVAGGPRPQPLLDREAACGMAVTVGRIRPCPLLGLRMVALVHNTVRGAAGGTLLVAELLEARGLLA